MAVKRCKYIYDNDDDLGNIARFFRAIPFNIFANLVERIYLEGLAIIENGTDDGNFFSMIVEFYKMMDQLAEDMKKRNVEEYVYLYSLINERLASIGNISPTPIGDFLYFIVGF